ncbi:MAG: hypothetical protein QF706_08975, partial [Roseibacillus sp.]|nr:hypothetical protein [Roseibacillus sp.]
MVGCSDDSAEKTPPDEADSPAKAGNAPFTFKVQSDRERQELAQREKEFDPSNDGWESEAFHGETTSQLKLLAESLSLDEPPGILSPNAASTTLRPANLVPVFQRHG